jgi:hypothetical protein
MTTLALPVRSSVEAEDSNLSRYGRGGEPKRAGEGAEPERAPDLGRLQIEL